LVPRSCGSSAQGAQRTGNVLTGTLMVADSSTSMTHRQQRRTFGRRAAANLQASIPNLGSRRLLESRAGPKKTIRRDP